jgi:hypothetical protein
VHSKIEDKLERRERGEKDVESKKEVEQKLGN